MPLIYQLVYENGRGYSCQPVILFATGAWPVLQDQPVPQVVQVPHIDFSTPTGNELVDARKGYGLTPPAGTRKEEE